MPERVDKLEEDLRRAVLSRCYTVLPERARLYREAVEWWIRSLPSGDGRVPQIAARACEVLQAALAQVRCEREQLAWQLAQIPKLKCFLDAPSDLNLRVRFDG